jgi:2-succinyl-5-enolpyruvyl-6-hydroxy-3-cyclohexene-1-carboxylate synthase
VLCQRGANGIDGLISGAAGAASTGSAVTLVLGDISFLHDVSGLWSAALAGSSLTIVVLNNGGGRIFEDLPLAQSGNERAMNHFTTPHQVELEAAASMYGLAYSKASTQADLRACLTSKPNESRARIVEVVLPREGLERSRRLLRQRVAERLAERP